MKVKEYMLIVSRYNPKTRDLTHSVLTIVYAKTLYSAERMFKKIEGYNKLIKECDVVITESKKWYCNSEWK